MTPKILVTGAAGFIGFHMVKKLCASGYQVVGIDNLNSYYDPELKKGRLAESGINAGPLKENELVTSAKFPSYRFAKLDIRDKSALEKLFNTEGFDYVLHLAAQAGVRYSITHPDEYISCNITGFYNILECCRHWPVKHLLFASSSSVYGNRTEVPFREDIPVDKPVSLYAATKKSNELMAYTYSHLYRVPLTGLRFFTVYGPWGRPDMAYFSFSEKITNGEPISIFNNGNLQRDFTYVDDIVDAIERLVNKPETEKEAEPGVKGSALYRILNIGHSDPVVLDTFIRELEKQLQLEAIRINKPMQAGDVLTTYADVSALESIIGKMKHTSLTDGLGRFVKWYRAYKNLPVPENADKSAV
ncbi:NAD-dependent epimerase/dehydratase family protein [Pollutibacter soli]|uniref:NAD-dependent epimerase/dehydratase family protein n=1 Tax=Pollutibacter soli TaxID=3034157 RepID=UPI0030135D31